MEIALSVVEALIALPLGVAAWSRRGTRPCVLFAIGFGMMVCMPLHNFGFGVLRIEGPGGERTLALLVGFGIIAAVMVGFPIGLALGVALYHWRRPGTASALGRERTR